MTNPTHLPSEAVARGRHGDNGTMPVRIYWSTSPLRYLAPIALQLSDLHHTSTDGIPITDLTTARRLHEALCRGHPEGIHNIYEEHAEHLIMWAPPSADTTNRALGAYRKWCTQHNQPLRLTLLILATSNPAETTSPTSPTSTITRPSATDGRTSHERASCYGSQPTIPTAAERDQSPPPDL